MQELATGAVGTDESLMVALTLFSLVLGRDVCFLAEFMFSVGEGAQFPELAGPVEFPMDAELPETCDTTSVLYLVWKSIKLPFFRLPSEYDSSRPRALSGLGGRGDASEPETYH